MAPLLSFGDGDLLEFGQDGFLGDDAHGLMLQGALGVLHRREAAAEAQANAIRKLLRRLLVERLAQELGGGFVLVALGVKFRKLQPRLAGKIR